jgi:hypothetical protein
MWTLCLKLGLLSLVKDIQCVLRIYTFPFKQYEKPCFFVRRQVYIFVWHTFNTSRSNKETQYRNYTKYLIPFNDQTVDVLVLFQYNKLGLDETNGWFFSGHVEQVSNHEIRNKLNGWNTGRGNYRERGLGGDCHSSRQAIPSTKSIYRKNWSLFFTVFFCKRDKACNWMIARD